MTVRILLYSLMDEFTDKSEDQSYANQNRHAMKKENLKEEMLDLFRTCPGNVVTEENALPGCAGLVMFEEPVFGFADAADPLFQTYKKPQVIGGVYMVPDGWLSGAKTVVSFFLRFQENVRHSNYGKPEETSPEWLHARIEGQAFLNAYTRRLKEWFEEQKITACAPAVDERFKTGREIKGDDDPEGIHFSSAWSERHAAYAAGLGTFSLTRGLISKRGMAGRYGSVIISEYIEPDVRSYAGVYDYCIRCGACIKRCPVNAISLEHGKNQSLCREWVEDVTAVRYKPRYGCGKCQTQVPCEAACPGLRALTHS